MLFSRQFSQVQASGIERSRRSVQRLIKAHHWPAKQVICAEILVFLCHSFLLVPAGEESAPDGAGKAVAPGAHRCCSGSVKRRGRIQGLLVQDTHFSEFPGHFRNVSSHTAIDLHAVLCRAVSRISITIFPVWGEVRCLLVCVSVPLDGMSPREKIPFTDDPQDSFSACQSKGISLSTSKTDALDDDETPLRLMASQTATTRGVIVSGINGALHIAPTLHVVELGLKNQQGRVDQGDGRIRFA